MNPSVGVWTRPIDTRLHDLQNREQRNPTSRSMKRRTLAASTRSISMSRGSSNADCTADFVISLKETLLMTPKSFNNSFSRQAMNSPSLSGSVAMYISSTFFADALRRIAVITRSARPVHDQGGFGSSLGLAAHIALLSCLVPPLFGRS